MKFIVAAALLGPVLIANAAQAPVQFQMPIPGIQSIAFYHGCMFGVLSTDPQKKTIAVFNEASKLCMRVVGEAEIDKSYRNQPGVSRAMAAAFKDVDNDLKGVFLDR